MRSSGNRTSANASFVHQVTYSDNYISRPQYRLHDFMLDAHHKRYDSAQEARKTTHSRADFLESRNASTMTLASAFSRIGDAMMSCFCCFSWIDKNGARIERSALKHRKDNDHIFSMVESEALRRGVPDGKEKAFEENQITSFSLQTSGNYSSYGSEFHPLKRRYSGNDFDVIDLNTVSNPRASREEG